MSVFEKYLVHAFMEEIPTDSLKAYAFDWDDNIQNLQTKIILRDSNGSVEEEVPTDEFTSKRLDPEIKRLIEEEGYYWDYIAFRDDKMFFADQASATSGPSWDDFIECLNGAHLFSIITARGHSVGAYKKVIYEMIMSNKDGIDKDEVLKNIKEYRSAVGHSLKLTDEQLIQKYVNQGRYYPVNNDEVKAQLGGSGDSASPEALKKQAFREFMKYVKSMTGVLIQKIGNREMTVGFSDDDRGNYQAIKDLADEEDMENVNVKYTGK